MALGVSAYSEAAFSAEPNDIVVHPTGIALTSTIGEESNVADANVSVTSIQATLTNAGLLLWFFCFSLCHRNIFNIFYWRRSNRYRSSYNWTRIIDI